MSVLEDDPAPSVRMTVAVPVARDEHDQPVCDRSHRQATYICSVEVQSGMDDRPLSAAWVKPDALEGKAVWLHGRERE